MTVGSNPHLHTDDRVRRTLCRQHVLLFAVTMTIRPCLNVLTESVHKICRQNLSKIKLYDWPNKLDATSWQV